MDEEQAADYAETLPNLAKELLLNSRSDRWIRANSDFDHKQHPFVVVNLIAKHLEAANLAECRQGRLGNQFDNLVIRLNERGQYVKDYINRSTQTAEDTND